MDLTNHDIKALRKAILYPIIFFKLLIISGFVAPALHMFVVKAMAAPVLVIIDGMSK